MSFIPKIKFTICLLVALFASFGADAQLFGDQLDSLEQQRLENIKVLHWVEEALKQ